MGYSRKWLADTLRRLGYQQAADDALRVLPDQIDLKQLRLAGLGGEVRQFDSLAELRQCLLSEG